jgi:MoaA/NifB/PqqE/SkfB family radical SAM enzyme
MNVNNKVTTFCVLPWIHSFVNSNGNYQVCCTAEEHHDGIPDKNGIYYNINNKSDINEIMNSDLLKEVRKDMLEGRWNKICTRCIKTEQDNGVSRRVIENARNETIIDELIAGTNPDGSLKEAVKFKSIDYRLGNMCNLECRMCGPHSSSKWLKDWNTVKPKEEQVDEVYRNQLENYNWIEKDYLLVEFKEKLKFVEQLHFAGGEPLFTPQMAQMLKFCVDLGVSKNITISYNTNATKLPPAVLELWKEFKGVKLLCSIDGFNKVNEYVRYPSKWETIDKNLTFLDENFEKYKIQEILLSCTVQALNVLELNQLYTYLKKFKNVLPALNLVNLHIPYYLKSTVLPKSAKKIATERLIDTAKDLEGSLPQEYKYLSENIYQVINFMNEIDQSDALPVFYMVNKNIDKVKGINFHDYIPELQKIVSEAVIDKIKKT